MATGPSIAKLPGWRTGLLIVLFVVVTLLFEFLLHRLEKWLKKQKRKGLIAAMNALKSELLFLGLMSLLLAAFQVRKQLCESDKQTPRARAPLEGRCDRGA